MASRIKVVKSVVPKQKVLSTEKRTRFTIAANVCAMRLTTKDDWSHRCGIGIKKGRTRTGAPFFVVILRANCHLRVR